MIQVTPNFNFSGNCMEAIKLYKEVFGAEIRCLIRYREANPKDLQRVLPEEQKDCIYHAEIYIGGQRIMMADSFDIPFQPGTSLSLTVTMGTKEEVIHAFDIIRHGCEIIYPLHSTTYSSCTVSFIDRFGFRWVLMTEQTER